MARRWIVIGTLLTIVILAGAVRLLGARSARFRRFDAPRDVDPHRRLPLLVAGGLPPSRWRPTSSRPTRSGPAGRCARTPPARRRRRDPQLLGAGAGREDRPHSRPDEPDVDRGRYRGTVSSDNAPSIAERHTPTCVSWSSPSARTEFSAWQARQRLPAAPASDRDRATFRDRGCAACHTIRGTGARRRCRARPHALRESHDAGVRIHPQHAGHACPLALRAGFGETRCAHARRTGLTPQELTTLMTATWRSLHEGRAARPAPLDHRLRDIMGDRPRAPGLAGQLSTTR